MNDRAIVKLKKGEGRYLKAGGAWVFDNEINRVEGKFENGEIVEVHDHDDYFMGYGFINSNSKIRVRMMSRRKEHPVNDELLETRIRNAWEYRKAVMCPEIYGYESILDIPEKRAQKEESRTKRLQNLSCRMICPDQLRLSAFLRLWNRRKVKDERLSYIHFSGKRYRRYLTFWEAGVLAL